MSRINAWINVLIAALIMVATLPGRTQGLGLITEPLLRDLHVDRVSYAQINLWATLLGAIVCLPAGRIFEWEMRLRHSMDVSWSDLPENHPKRMVDWR